jgi:hypothetical protein
MEGGKMIYHTFTTPVSCSKGKLPCFTVSSVTRELLADGEGPVAVCGEADGLAYRSVLWPESDGRNWFVELSPELAASGQFEDGKQIRVTMALDDEPREATIPYELTETLGMAALAERAWDKLSEAERIPYCEWVGAAVDPKERWQRAERAAVLVRKGEKLEMSAPSG